MFLHLQQRGGQRSEAGSGARGWMGGMTEVHTTDKTLQSHKSEEELSQDSGRVGWMRQDGNGGQDRKTNSPKQGSSPLQKITVDVRSQLTPLQAHFPCPPDIAVQQPTRSVSHIKGRPYAGHVSGCAAPI